MTKAHYISEWSVVNFLSYIHGKPRHINVISVKMPKYFTLTIKKENIHDNLIFPPKSNTALLHVCGLSSIGLGISLRFIGLKRYCVTVTIIKCMINSIHDQFNWSTHSVATGSCYCCYAPVLHWFVLWSVRSWFKIGKAWTGRHGNGGLWRITLSTSWDS